jgi:hypothetical protein
VSPGFFSVASDSSVYPAVDSAFKNKYQVNHGGKGGRCVRLTTYHLHVPMSRNLVVLTSWNPVGLFRLVMGKLYLLLCDCKQTSITELTITNQQIYVYICIYIYIYICVCVCVCVCVCAFVGSLYLVN